MSEKTQVSSGGDAASLKISYEEFLVQVHHEVIAAEWVDGVMAPAHPEYLSNDSGLCMSEGNRRVRSFLSELMRSHAERHCLGLISCAGEYELLGPNLKLTEQRVGRRPDIMFVAEANRVNMQKAAPVEPSRDESYKKYIPAYFKGTPDLVVEIVDDFSRERDRVQKFQEYQTAGIPEYWLIEDDVIPSWDAGCRQRDTTGVYQNVPLNVSGVPHVQHAAFFQLDASGVYQQVSPDANGIYRSRNFPGFWLREDWLWQSPMPSMSAIRKEFGLP